jgi:hypothetical protein
MLFTKFSQNAAQIEQTKGFDPMQKARRARAFCCPSERRKLPHPFQMMRDLREKAGTDKAESSGDIMQDKDLGIPLLL